MCRGEAEPPLRIALLRVDGEIGNVRLCTLVEVLAEREMRIVDLRTVQLLASRPILLRCDQVIVRLLHAGLAGDGMDVERVHVRGHVVEEIFRNVVAVDGRGDIGLLRRVIAGVDIELLQPGGVGGLVERQRIGLARAMVMEPELVVADEPISALDVSIRAQVLNLLKKFQKEKEVTYLFIAHDLSIVRFISDRIGVIYKGNIVEVAEAEELFNFPLHPYTHSLISAIPIPDPKLEKNKVLYTYDPSIHDYSEDKPEFVCIGHDHWVYGNKKEIEEYKALREKGEPIKSITIREEGAKEETHAEEDFSKTEAEFLAAPVHDTGKFWYALLSFFLPVFGIIAAMIFKKHNYIRNYKSCKKGAIAGFIVLGVIIVLFIILLLLTLV